MPDVREMTDMPPPDEKPTKRKRAPKAIETPEPVAAPEQENYLPFGEFVLRMAEAVVKGGGIGKLSHNGMLAFDINVRDGYQRVMDVIKRGPNGDA